MSITQSVCLVVPLCLGNIFTHGGGTHIFTHMGDTHFSHQGGTNISTHGGHFYIHGGTNIFTHKGTNIFCWRWSWQWLSWWWEGAGYEQSKHSCERSKEGLHRSHHPAPAEDLVHIFTRCRATADTRSRYLPEFLNTVAKYFPTCNLSCRLQHFLGINIDWLLLE